MKLHSAWGGLLVAWYQICKRDLPWRHTKDPYIIWISEIMLQQTRVETVKEYFRRFIIRFPDVGALAEASETDILKLWEGLGYYSRARNMQKAAITIVNQFASIFPKTSAELLTLPGIGAYTAGAIASIAFGEAIPAIDGNVKRVCSRLFGIRENIDAQDSQTLIRKNLTAAMPLEMAGDFNQALMELGATLCLPHMPKCEQCPLKELCDAHAEGDPESLPVHEPKAPVKAVNIAVCILTLNGKVLLTRRKERLLHGLYVFTLIEGVTEPENARVLLAENGLNAAFVQDYGDATHTFTHRVWRMRLLHFKLMASPQEAWLKEQHALFSDAMTLETLPIPTAMKAARSITMSLLQNQTEEFGLED